MGRIRITSLISLVWLLFASTAFAVTGQGVWIAFPNGTTCTNYNTAPINDQTLCYDSITGWQTFSGSTWKSPLLGGLPCSQMPALTGDVTSSAGSCATTSLGKTPGGRLTLTTGTPVMSADASAQGTIFYDTYVSNVVPVNNNYLTIAANEVSVILDSTNDLSGSLYDVFAINVSGVLTLCTGPAWTNSTTRSQAIALSNGVWTNSGSMTNCFNNAVNKGPISGGAGTYLGTFDATANGQTSMRFHPAAAAGGSLASTTCALCLFNAYNRVPLSSTSFDNTSTWTYATATWRAADGNNNNRITYLDGLGQLVASCTYGVLNTGAVSAETGCDFNSTSATPANPAYSQSSTGGWNYSATDFVPTLGLNFVQAVEYSSGATTTFYGTGASGGFQTQSLKVNVSM